MKSKCFSYSALMMALLAFYCASGAFSAVYAEEAHQIEFAPPANLILVQENTEHLSEGHMAANPELGEPHVVSGESEHAQESAGLPQLDPSWYPSQMFWLLLTFLSMYLLFSRKVLPELSSTLENRRSHIQNDLDTAETLREQAEKAQHNYEELLKDANQQAMALMQEPAEQLKKQHDIYVAEFAERSAKDIAKAEAEVLEATKAAMSDMHEIAAEIASQAAHKIVGITTDIKDAKNVVEFIDERKKAA